MSESVMGAGAKPALSEFVLACMRHRERQAARQTKLMACAALPGLAINAFFLTILMYFVFSAIAYLWGSKDYMMSWPPVFLICVPLSVPLFWWIDRCTQEHDITEDADDGGAPTMVSLPLGMAWSLLGMAPGAAKGLPIFNAVLLAGPRQMRKVINRLQAARRFDSACRERAEAVLRHMVTFDHRIYVHKLLRKSEDLSNLVPAIGYLLFYEWVGTSEDALYIWLSGDARQTLERAVRGGLK